MIYFVCIFFGLIPSAIWLSFYLRKDVHPESNRMILKIFFYGMLIALTAAAVEIIIEKFLNFANKGDFISPLAFSLLYYFIGVAFVEEFLKYFVVKKKVLNNSEFDEPTDAMIYMIDAALGFAALENILVLFPGLNTFTFIDTTIISSFRFIGATFLHALCSGTVGFFLALSILKPRKKLLLISSGLAIAAILHGLYNFSIIKLEHNFNFIYILIILLSALAFFISFGFKKLKKIKSVCEIK